MIRVSKSGKVYRDDCQKVEKLPFAAPYGNKQPGFNDHIDEQGNIYRVTFATWTTSKKVTYQTTIKK